MEYPELAARTNAGTAGAPRAVTVSSDGERVTYLRSAGPEDLVDRLWVFDVATGEERLVCDPTEIGAAGRAPSAELALRERLRLTARGIGSYAANPAGTLAALGVGGVLVVVDLVTGTAEIRPTEGPVVDPRPDPAGQRIAYVTGATLRVLDRATGTDTLLAGEAGARPGARPVAGAADLPARLPGGEDVTWGLPDFIAAEEFGRYQGFWWAPDGMSILAARVDNTRVQRWHLHDPAVPGSQPRRIAYPAAGTANAEVTLHLLDLDGGWVDVHWDRETYPYLVDVSWTELGGPLVTVLRRLQQHGLVLAVDPRTGETQVHAELADPRWVDPIPGSPCHLVDGRVLVGGELAHDGYDARCLFADGVLVTPPTLYVRRVCGHLGQDLLVEASEGEPSEQHLYRVATRPTAAPRASRITPEPGWHVGHAGGETIVVGARSLDHDGTQWTVLVRGEPVGRLPSVAARQPYAPRPVLERVTDRRLPTGVLYPRAHVAGRCLPVLVDIYGGPGHQEVVAARSSWQQRQWWADSGFAVAVVDNRGTPGVAPSFEKVVHRRLADVILGDQVDALLALGDKHPDLDLTRVAIRGWSFGGWLAALALLRRPDVYRCAIAGAPVADWSLYDTAYTERYLGLPEDGSDIYPHNSLLRYAAQAPPGDPRGGAAGLLLIHGMVDDNVVAAHSMRLSAALLRAGRPHAVIPLTGATHLASGAVAEQLLRLELDFLSRALA